ncbi:MAG: hypothetical protein AB8U25_00465 [Rickettsiales endosymbiont of Dermacentor nuttalli]
MCIYLLHILIKIVDYYKCNNRMSFLIAQSVLMLVINEYSISPLYFAVNNGNLEGVKKLVENVANINNENTFFIPLYIVLYMSP